MKHVGSASVHVPDAGFSKNRISALGSVSSPIVDIVKIPSAVTTTFLAPRKDVVAALPEISFASSTGLRNSPEGSRKIKIPPLPDGVNREVERIRSSKITTPPPPKIFCLWFRHVYNDGRNRSIPFLRRLLVKHKNGTISVAIPLVSNGNGLLVSRNTDCPHLGPAPKATVLGGFSAMNSVIAAQPVDGRLNRYAFPP